MRALAIAAALLAASPGAATANAWRVLLEESEISFRYTVDGEALDGAFEDFTAAARFDPGAPSTAELALTIDVASISLPNVFHESIVTGVGWFEAEDHPTASYRLTALTPAGDQRYRAAGVLTIKDISAPLVTDVALTIDGDRAEVRGDLRFDRRAFRLGGPASALFYDIGEEIVVQFDLAAVAIR